ncbi:MAG: tetratricopeptide repeat protein [Tannerella sp.]|jgi:signal transduction histidine kinase|nr:tetratricopeptide repeat protein [Tannerella sp.]
MKRSLFVLLLLFVTSVCSFGQDLDSLFLVMMDTKGNEFINVANTISKSTKDTTVFTNATSRETVLSHVMRSLIKYYYDLQQFKKVEQYSNIIIPIYEEIGDSLNLAGCYHIAGIAYHHLGLFDRAIESYYKSSEILQAIGGDNSLRRSRYVLNNIASIYVHLNNLEMAEKLFLQCIEMINDQESNRINMLDLSNYLNNLSDIDLLLSESLEGNIKQAKIDEAISRAEKALDLARQYEDEPAKITKRLVTLSSAYIANKEYIKAENLMPEALNTAEQNNLDFLLAEIYANKAELSGINGNTSQANSFFEKAIEILEKNDYKQLFERITHRAYLFNRDTDPTKALHYHEKYVTTKDSIFAETTQRQLSEFEVKYATAEKELEIERQQTVINRQKTQQYLLIGGMLIATVIVAMLFYILHMHRRRNRELADMNATKDKFFSIISHDLKNPVVIQRDSLQLMAENARQWDSGIMEDCSRKLHQSASGLANLLFTLLDWAQIQTGRIPYLPIQFDLTEALQSDIGIIKNMTTEKGVYFETQIPASYLITGDLNMLTTIVRNLLANAVKFTPSGGTVTLVIKAPSNSPKGGENPPPSEGLGEAFTVSVSDTGIGMNSEQILTLFSLDSQRSRRGTAGEKGAGLGLIVCRDFLQKHGSTLHVESEEGKGSRFWFTV